MTHEDDQRATFTGHIETNRTAIATLEAEREALLKSGAPEVTPHPKDAPELIHEASVRYRYFERVAAIERDLTVHQFELKSLERQLAEVAA